MSAGVFQRLKEIDAVLREHDLYYHYDASPGLRLHEQDEAGWATFVKHFDAARSAEAKYKQEILELADSLTEEELLRVFESCGRIMGDYLIIPAYSHYHSGYQTLFIKAIARDHDHAYRLLARLNDTMPPDEFEDVLLIALHQTKARTIDTALLFAKASHAVKTIEAVRVLTSHPHSVIATLARDTLSVLESET